MNRYPCSTIATRRGKKGSETFIRLLRHVFLLNSFATSPPNLWSADTEISTNEKAPRESCRFPPEMGSKLHVRRNFVLFCSAAAQVCVSARRWSIRKKKLEFWTKISRHLRSQVRAIPLKVKRIKKNGSARFSRSGMQGNFQTLPKEERFQRNRRLNRQLNQHHWAPRTARKMSTSKVSALVLNHLHDLIITNI